MMEEIKQNSAKAWLLAARPKTLAAAIVPVLVGCAMAFHDGKFAWRQALACLLFAIMMQIAANLINDLYDYLKGSDGEDRLGPLRATSQGWISESAMKKGIAIVIAAGCLCGLSLLFFTNWEIIFVGIFCVLFAYFYTSGPYPLSYNGLGDIAVVLFFGLVAVGFTYYVQTFEWTCDLTFISIATGLVVNTLLVVNNYRDRETDARSGKRTVIVRFGETFGKYLYLFSGLSAAFISIAVLMLNSNYYAALLLAYVILHIFSWKKLCKINKGKELNVLIGESSRNMLIFAVLLSVALCV